MKKGLFIVFEGQDGVGKSTQSRKLVSSLCALGVHASWMREPSEGPIGQFIESSADEEDFHWETKALLFAADRRENAYRDLLPKLRSGITVVSDRYDYSSYIYQGIYSPNQSDGWLWMRQLNFGLPRPDLTLVLDVSTPVAKHRRMLRGAMSDLYDDDEVQEKLAQEYKKLGTDGFFSEPIHHIDGELDQAQIEQSVLNRVMWLYKQSS